MSLVGTHITIKSGRKISADFCAGERCVLIDAESELVYIQTETNCYWHVTKQFIEKIHIVDRQ